MTYTQMKEALSWKNTRVIPIEKFQKKSELTKFRPTLH